ncbi:CBASS oligonucleotide cyclase [Nostoc sp. 'Lobaria pulmonaria (5183) cyanobiont']|jgi:Second Messenger Oligonucleotide or Dinucleotide Synthetase domain|uniref:CBASS oligonucleotide cyclase n=1 Tax=Nostoc sp. 'Lobaria pulmonaria (5183) cyanobiont' TaxID=1618022 RepID=UPI000CF34ABA|nr:CBASS oligonucleotide cyclase [Nostoc sp. 'Lobaria pulmonaria (5183) cyanobiont']AVH74486.1 hypothetical protein NLP_40031 [Nostoc sp. 'Lobaria pulmonaria (5183) cyanobiont']
MPKTISQGFNKLRENLEITYLQETTVSTRQNNVREAVEKEIIVLNSFLTGSYKRSTMIAPLSDADIDIFVVLHPQYYSNINSPSYLLDKVKFILKKTYPNTPKISRNGQAVTINFSEFQVDVVPAFCRQGGGYLIPNSVLVEWISTDPKKHIEIWSAANTSHNYKLVPLIKMIKGWNKKHGRLLNSFHLENLVIQILNNVQISDFPSGVRYIFDKARERVKLPVIDPAGYGGNIAAYLNKQNQIDHVVNKFETAYTAARQAEILAEYGKIEEAYKQWRIIFDNYFPTYGIS